MTFDEFKKKQPIKSGKKQKANLIAKKKWLKDHTILKPLNLARKTEILDNRLIGHLNEWKKSKTRFWECVSTLAYMKRVIIFVLFFKTNYSWMGVSWMLLDPETE